MDSNFGKGYVGKCVFDNESEKSKLNFLYIGLGVDYVL